MEERICAAVREVEGEETDGAGVIGVADVLEDAAVVVIAISSAIQANNCCCFGASPSPAPAGLPALPALGLPEADPERSFPLRARAQPAMMLEPPIMESLSEKDASSESAEMSRMDTVGAGSTSTSMLLPPPPPPPPPSPPPPRLPSSQGEGSSAAAAATMDETLLVGVAVVVEVIVFVARAAADEQVAEAEADVADSEMETTVDLAATVSTLTGDPSIVCSDTDMRRKEDAVGALVVRAEAADVVALYAEEDADADAAAAAEEEEAASTHEWT